MKPYQEVINKNNSRLREFKIDIDSNELIFLGINTMVESLRLSPR